jgi:hypothetical protein
MEDKAARLPSFEEASQNFPPNQADLCERPGSSSARLGRGTRGPFGGRLRRHKHGGGQSAELVLSR